MYDDIVQTSAVSSSPSPYEGFDCIVQTQRLNFDTINRKTMSRLSLIGDNEYGTDTPEEVLVQWSDDDYTTWNDGQYLEFTLYGDLPAIHQLGSFRQRSFKFTWTHSSSPIRILGMEVDINKGIR